MPDKKRWWLADERFKKVHRELRLNYEKAARDAEARADARVLTAMVQLDNRLQQVKDQYADDNLRQIAAASDLAAQIARVRLEFGPSPAYGTRFQMFVTMDENFMRGTENLKEIGPFVINMLMAKIKREFAQIDFGRAKPIQPRTPKELPRWQIDSTDHW